MALKARLDSRVILAIGLHAGIDAETYKYGINKATLLARDFAPNLSGRIGVPHKLVGQAVRLRNYAPVCTKPIIRPITWVRSRDLWVISTNRTRWT